MIDELRREDTPIARNIADHIDSFTDYDFAHLLFSDGTVENAISLDNQLNIIQVAAFFKKQPDLFGIEKLFRSGGTSPLLAKVFFFK